MISSGVSAAAASRMGALAAGSGGSIQHHGGVDIGVIDRWVAAHQDQVAFAQRPVRTVFDFEPALGTIVQTDLAQTRPAGSAVESEIRLVGVVDRQTAALRFEHQRKGGVLDRLDLRQIVHDENHVLGHRVSSDR